VLTLSERQEINNIWMRTLGWESERILESILQT